MDGQMERQTDRHGQTYIPLPLAGDKKKERKHLRMVCLKWSRQFHASQPDTSVAPWFVIKLAQALATSMY